MKIIILAICMAVALPLQAERRRAVAAAQPDALSIQFVDVPAAEPSLFAVGSDAWVDMKTLSKHAGSTGTSMNVRRRFGVRVLRAGGVSWGTATITARLESQDGRSSLRIDGQPLGSTPVVIERRATVGAMTIHTLDIEVTDSVAAGPLMASIAWEVTTQ